MSDNDIPRIGKCKVSDAALCRSKGWEQGDILQAEPTERSDTHLGTQRVRITAIGEDSILVRVLSGPRRGKEIRWAKQLLSYAITKVDP